MVYISVIEESKRSASAISINQFFKGIAYLKLNKIGIKHYIIVHNMYQLIISGVITT